MKLLTSSLQKKIFTIFGDIRIYPYPLFFLYHPKGYKISGEKFEKAAKQIKQFDILLRRYDTYLDKVFIPGYWNHAAICIKENQAFSTILHATSDGVNTESLFDFMKTDHVCILRPNFSFNKEKLIAEMNQIIGKPYDFDFNFDDPTEFSCTEIVNFLFRNYETGINRKQFLGKMIVPPDSIYMAKGFLKIVT